MYFGNKERTIHKQAEIFRSTTVYIPRNQVVMLFYGNFISVKITPDNVSDCSEKDKQLLKLVSVREPK